MRSKRYTDKPLTRWSIEDWGECLRELG